MKRLIPIGIRQLGITLFTSVCLLGWFTVINAGLIGGSDIYLMIATLSFIVQMLIFLCSITLLERPFF